MKAARAAASDGGYCLGRVSGRAGPLRTGPLGIEGRQRLKLLNPLKVAFLLEFHGPPGPVCRWLDRSTVTKPLQSAAFR